MADKGIGKNFFQATIVYTPDGNLMERKEFSDLEAAHRFLNRLRWKKKQNRKAKR